MLNEDYIMNIFQPLYEKLPELKEYLTWYFKEKETNVIGSNKKGDRVHGVEKARAELFYPSQVTNQKTTSCCKMIAGEITECIVL